MLLDKVNLSSDCFFMIVEKRLRQLLHELIKDETATITLGGSDVTVHVFDQARKIHLSSPVYLGGDFIPQSVRNAVLKKPLFHTQLKESILSISETSYEVVLNYIGRLDHLNKRMFIDLLEDFSALSDEWRLFLDEHDKHDLIHVRVPKS